VKLAGWTTGVAAGAWLGVVVVVVVVAGTVVVVAGVVVVVVVVGGVACVASHTITDTLLAPGSAAIVSLAAFGAEVTVPPVTLTW
jgi:hypothetical protein